MVGKCCTILLATAGVAIGLCAVALAVIDITNDAEPSRPEAWVASTVLQVRVRTQKPRQPDHFAMTEDDLDRASTMYQQMGGFAMERREAGWPLLRKHPHHGRLSS
jgi:hypothetical protein